MRGLNGHWPKLLIAVLVTVLTALPQPLRAQTTGADLPDIGSGANSTMTLNDEYQLGLMVVRNLRDQGLILEDPEVTDYIQTLGSRIVAHIPESEQRYTFFVVREGGINAFALPGGFIGVNYGLITATANESQLASVLAHEIAHVKQRHIARAIQAQGRSTMASAAAMLAAIVIGMATGTPDAMQAGMAIAQGTAMQQQINFTRANEYEADRIGISFLASAGFDPNAMPDFFETIGRRRGL
ncbi:MAG: M48 family peptidase, partial [Gammaproteobacteria bacterium]|nr:M48 family peptidase [Gammaproteobacteria bacterium]